MHSRCPKLHRKDNVPTLILILEMTRYITESDDVYAQNNISFTRLITYNIPKATTLFSVCTEVSYADFEFLLQ